MERVNIEAGRPIWQPPTELVWSLTANPQEGKLGLPPLASGPIWVTKKSFWLENQVAANVWPV